MITRSSNEPKKGAKTLTLSTKILAYTPTHGSKPKLASFVREIRGSAGCWFDWAIYGGALAPETKESAEALLKAGDGIQYFGCWPENRGQHWATRAALALAREKGYEWLLRIDDDIQPKTKRWLKQMVEKLDELAKIHPEGEYKFVAAPRILKLRNPLKPRGKIEVVPFAVDVMDILGGACRLAPVKLLDGWEPDIYSAVGRKDPEGIMFAVTQKEGLMIRFPDIRVIHDTAAIEGAETPEQTHTRKMGHHWPYLGAEC